MPFAGCSPSATLRRPEPASLVITTIVAISFGLRNSHSFSNRLYVPLRYCDVTPLDCGLSGFCAEGPSWITTLSAEREISVSRGPVLSWQAWLPPAGGAGEAAR